MNSYQAECVKLESTHWHEPNRRLLHAAMGLVTESVELLGALDEANYREELGDVMWYVAVGCDALQITIHEAVETVIDNDFEGDPLGAIISTAAEVVDLLKKQIFYGRDVDQRVLAGCLGVITLSVSELAEDLGWTLEDVKVANLEKLHRRYRSGTFSREEALNRDVKGEMTVYS